MADETVNLNVTVGGDAAGDVKDLTAALEAAARAEAHYAQMVKQAADYKQAAAQFDKAINDELERRAKDNLVIEPREKKGGTYGGKTAEWLGRGAQTFAGGGAMGLVGKAGPWGAGLAAGAAAFETGIKKLTEAVNIAQNGMLTAAQKGTMLRDEFIPFHKSIRQFREALDGTTEAVAAAMRKQEREMASINYRAAARSDYRSFEADRYQPIEAMLRAENHPGAPRLTAGSITAYDRSSAIGERKSAEAAIRDPAADAVGRADRAARGSALNRDTQAGISAEAQRARDRAKEEADAAVKRVRDLRAAENSGGDRNKKGIAEATADANIALERFARLDAQAKAEMERHANAITKAAEDEGAARRAVIDLQKAELQILEQKEQRMAGFAQKLGSMNEGDFEMAKAALEALKESGIENLPAEMADMAAQVAPEFVAKEREKLGEKRAKEIAGPGGVGQGLDDSLLASFEKETIAQVRAQVDKVRADVRVSVDIDAKTTAEEILKGLAPIMGAFGKALDVRVQKLEEKLYVDKVQRINAEG